MKENDYEQIGIEEKKSLDLSGSNEDLIIRTESKTDHILDDSLLIINEPLEKKASKGKKAAGKNAADEKLLQGNVKKHMPRTISKDIIEKMTENQKKKDGLYKDTEGMLISRRDEIKRDFPEAKKRKKVFQRRTTLALALYENEGFWNERKNDLNGNDKLLADREKVNARIDAKNAIINQILSDDGMMKESGMEPVIRKLLVLEKMLSNPLVTINGVEELLGQYDETISAVGSYTNTSLEELLDKKGKVKNSPGRELLRSLYTIIMEERNSLDSDMKEWKENGFIPAVIEKGSDIIERKHITGDLEGSGKQMLIRQQIKLLSSKRDNGSDDSAKMKKVKLTYTRFVQAMFSKMYYEDEDLNPQIGEVDICCDELIKACNSYLRSHKNPSSDDGKERRALVEGIMKSAQTDKLGLPLAAKELAKEKNEDRTWADAYGLSVNMVQTLVNRDYKSREMVEKNRTDEVVANMVDLLDKAKQAERQKKKTQEKADKIVDPEKRRQYIRKQNMKKASPAMIWFFRTGKWEENLSRDDLKKNAVPRQDWVISRFEDWAYDEFFGNTWIDDAHFRENVETMNRQAAANLKAIEDMDVKDLRDRFLKQLRGSFANHASDDEIITMGNMGVGPERIMFAQEMAEAGHIAEPEFGSSQEYYSIERIVNLGFDKVDSDIRKFFKYKLMKDPSCMSDMGLEMLLGLNSLVQSQEDYNELETLRELGKTNDKATEELGLLSRGKDIYDSKVVRKIILGEIKLTDEEYKMIRENMEDIDKLLEDMIQQKFSCLSFNQIRTGLREYLGEQVFFGKYDTVRDLAEEYLRKISVTNREAAKIENDYNVAYRKAMKNGAFSKKLQSAGALFLYNKPRAWKSSDEKDPAKDRVDRMKNRLRMVAIADKALAEVTADVKLTQAGWNWLMNRVEYIIARRLSQVATPDDSFFGNKKNEEELVGLCKGWFGSAIETRKRYEAERKKLDVYISRDEYLADGIPEEKYVRTGKVKQYNVIHADDYTFAGLLRGPYFLESEEIKTLIPDVRLREFLRDNIGSTITCNPELKQLFPFLKDIESMDQMETLTISQFKCVLNHFKNNLLEPEIAEGIRNLLMDSDKKRETEQQFEVRKYVLLELMKHKTDAKGMSEIISRKNNDFASDDELHYRRAMIALGKKGVVRDGKIHYRYSDIKEDYKSWLKKNNYFARRLKRFERAHEVWGLLEELGPEAVAQMKRWIRMIMDITLLMNDQDQDKRFKRIADLLSFDYKAENEKIAKIEKENEKLKKEGKKLKEIERKTFDYNISPDLDEAYRKSKTGKKDKTDLLTDMREVFMRGRAKDSEDTSSPLPEVFDYLLEMCMFDYQDIVLGHGGTGCGLLWEDKSKRSETTYRQNLYRKCRDTVKKADEIDDELSRIEDPELRKKLRDQMAPLYMQMKFSYTRTRHLDNRDLAKARETIEDADKRLEEYKKEESKYEEADSQERKKLQALIEKTKEEKDAAQAVIDRITSKKGLTKMGPNELQERLENQKLFGIGSVGEIGSMLASHIRDNGEFSTQLCDTVALYNSRRSMFERYGEGELAPFWDELEKIDEFFKDLMDPADTVAEARIKMLYEKLSPLGKALKNQYSYVNDYFIERELRELLNPENKEAVQIWDARAKESPEDQVKYWTERLNSAQKELMGSAVKGEKSVHENMAAAHEKLRKMLAEHYFETVDFEENVKRQEKSMEEGFFKKAQEMEKLASKRNMKITHSRDIALRKADGVIYNIETYILTDPECIQAAYNGGTLENLYKDIAAHYVKNTETAERCFLQYVLKKEYDVRNAFSLSDDTLKRKLEALNDAERTKIENRRYAFTMHVQGPCITEKADVFEQEIQKRVEYFVEETNLQLQNDISFTEEYREGAKKRQQEREKAELEVRKVKSEGRRAYDKELFGGNLDALKNFGAKKTALIYGKSGKDGKELLSRGEEKDKKIYDEARKHFVRKEGREAYPDFLADCLNEYIRLKGSVMKSFDEVVSWMAGENSEVVNEEIRLKAIWDYGKEKAGIPEAMMEFYTAYLARFVELNVGVQVKEGLEAAIKRVSDEIEPYIKKMQELNDLDLKNPSLKLAIRDTGEKMRAYIFTENTKLEFGKFRDMIDAQTNFFMHAEDALSIIEDVVKKDSYTAALGDVYQARYINSLYEYFVGDMITESRLLADDRSRVFDRQAFREKVQQRIVDSAAREALVVKDGSVSYLDMRETNIYAGSVDRNEFEQQMVRCFGEDFVADYSKLDDDEQKLFAMALYVGKKENRGTMQAIYGLNDSEVRDARNDIMSYMKSEKVVLKPDYGKAMRAFASTGKGTKILADKSLFDQALVFVRQVNSQRDDLRPKDYKRMAAHDEIALAADELRVGLGSKYRKFEHKNHKAMQNVDLDDRHAFLSKLNEYQKTDQERSDNTNKRIEETMRELSELKVSQQSLLIYVLQDRTALDYSVKKDKETKLYPFVNAEKRFALFEELRTAEGRMNAMKKAADPKVIEESMRQLLSFQLRDDKELSEGKLKEDDFAPEALKRGEDIDWDLLRRAIDFVKETENEYTRISTVRLAGELLKNDEISKDSKEAKYYFNNQGRLETGSELEKFETMEKIMLDAYARDKEDIKGTSLQSTIVMDDLMAGYNALTPEEKNLFFRALEHRDILDVSQKNLYLNILGAGDRDYVNPQGRDELIDEFIANKGNVDLKRTSYSKAFLSLCSTQIDDSMDFSKIKGVEDAKKNVTVTHQLMVQKRGTWFGGPTRFDWKLFARALQFVYRTVNEMKLAAGDEEIYKALGDQSQGEMKIDRSYLRQNLHHTGARFLRFLGGEAAQKLESPISIFDSAADYADFVFSAKTANLIKSKTNQLVGRGQKNQYEQAEDKEKEKQDQLNAEQEAKEEEREREKLAEEKAKKKEAPKDVKEKREATIEENKKKIKTYETNEANLKVKIEEQQSKLGKDLSEDDRKKAQTELEKYQKNLSKQQEEREKLEEEQKTAEHDLEQAKRDLRREAAEHNNNIATIVNIATSVKEQKEMIKDMAEKAGNVIDDYRELFGLKKEEPLPEELDSLAKSLKDVEVEKPVRKESLTGDPKLDRILSIPGIAVETQKFLSDAVLGDPELVTGVAAYINQYVVHKVLGQGFIDSMDAVDVKLLEWDKVIQDTIVPKPVQEALDKALDVVTKSEAFLKNMSYYVGEGVQILGNFKDIIGAAMNIHKLSKVQKEAEKEKAGDQEKINGVDATVFNKELIEKASRNNLALLDDLSYLTKNAEGRKILANVGDLATRITKYAGVEGVDEIINAAVHLADYIWKVISDTKSIKKYYGSAGNEILAKLAGGKQKFEKTEVGKKYKEKNRDLKTVKPDVKENGKEKAKGQEIYVVDSVAYDLLQNGQGFERDEELGDYLKLNMIHSLIFSSSKYNPLKQSRMIAECALTVLGLEDCIGKTDADTANEVFRRLKK